MSSVLLKPRAIALLLVAFALCLAAIRHGTRPSPGTTPRTAEAALQQAAEAASQQPANSNPAAMPVSAKQPSVEDQADVETAEPDAANPRVTELYRLVVRRDASAREVLMAELANPDPAVRRAALDGVIQLGDRSMIPRLRELEAATEDTVEKAELLEAINYIELPSLTEYLAQRAAMPPSARTNVPRATVGRPKPSPRSASTPQTL